MASRDGTGHSRRRAWQAAALDGSIGPAVVVVGFDGTEPACRALAYAAGVCERSGARLVVVHAASPERGHLALKAVSWKMRRRIVDVLGPNYLNADLRVYTGRRVRMLRRACEDAHADLVVIGAPRGAFRRLRPLTDRLTGADRCPVLVIP